MVEVKCNSSIMKKHDFQTIIIIPLYFREAMETLIREGALRHLLNNDVSCDVILSCKGHRLMAHKLILSMASPVFRVSEFCNLDSTAIRFFCSDRNTKH